MPAYNPQPFITVNGQTYTDDTLEGVTITMGRASVDEQPRAGYSSISIVTKDATGFPTFELDDEIQIGVLDTSSNPKPLFTGRVSDVQRNLSRFGETGYLTETKVTGIGLLALLNRRAVGATGYPEELDGVRIEKIISDAVALDYPAYEQYYDDNEVLPLRTNLIPNPSFEVNTTGWAANNGTIARSTAQTYIGTASVLITGTGLGFNGVFGFPFNNLPATEGLIYTLSAYVFVPTGNPSRNYSLAIIWRNSTNTANVATSATAVAISSNSTWQRITLTATAPIGAFFAVPRVIASAASIPIGEFYYVDGFLLEQAAAPAGNYFDGSLLATQPVYFTGTPHNSTSIRGGDAGSYVVADDQTWESLDPYAGSFDSGAYDVLAYSGGATNAYNLASQVANSGRGVIFEKPDGKIYYSDAASRINQTNFTELPPSAILAAGLSTTERLSDLANDITIQYGTNQTTQTEDTNSVDEYGRLAAKVSTVLADTGAAEIIRDYYLSTRAYPRRSLSQITIPLHLDNMSNTLRDDLLDVFVGSGLTTNALPVTIYTQRFTGFIEGYTWTITRNTIFLTLNVSEYALSVLAQTWSQVSPTLDWDNVNAALEWQEARIVA